MRLERHRYLASAAIAIVFSAAGGSIQAGATTRAAAHPERSSPAGAGVINSSNPRGSFGSALVGSARVKVGPSALAIDTATDTIYSANGTNANGPNRGGDTVSVIDGRDCQAHDVSLCKGPWPTIKVGSLPSTITVDEVTDTVYVTIDGETGSDTVAVFNGATCNGRVTWGCDQKPARVRVRILSVRDLRRFREPHRLRSQSGRQLHQRYALDDQLVDMQRGRSGRMLDPDTTDRDGRKRARRRCCQPGNPHRVRGRKRRGLGVRCEHL